MDTCLLPKGIASPTTYFHCAKSELIKAYLIKTPTTPFIRDNLGYYFVSTISPRIAGSPKKKLDKIFQLIYQ